VTSRRQSDGATGVCYRSEFLVFKILLGTSLERGRNPKWPWRAAVTPLKSPSRRAGQAGVSATGENGACDAGEDFRPRTRIPRRRDRGGATEIDGRPETHGLKQEIQGPTRMARPRSTATRGEQENLGKSLGRYVITPCAHGRRPACGRGAGPRPAGPTRSEISRDGFKHGGVGRTGKGGPQVGTPKRPGLGPPPVRPKTAEAEKGRQKSGAARPGAERAPERNTQEGPSRESRARSQAGPSQWPDQGAEAGPRRDAAHGQRATPRDGAKGAGSGAAAGQPQTQEN